MYFKHQTLVLNIPLIIIGFFLLNRGAGMLVDGASSIARKFKFPETMVGFTIVALGTALPKFFTNIIAVMNGYNDLFLGNIIGSGIVNLLGIIGLVGLNRSMRATRYTVFIGFPIAILSTFLVYILSNNLFLFKTNEATPDLDFNDGIYLLIAFVLFMTYAYFNVKKNHTIWFTKDTEEPEFYPFVFAVILVVVGVVGSYAGAILVVDNLIDLSRKYDISQRFLGQFILSVGGSLAMFWWTKNFKINQTRFEISQLLGTNLLYLLGILGTCAIIAPIPFNIRYNLDLFLLIIANIVMILLLVIGRKLSINLWKSKVLVFLFLVYITYLFVR
ncbi:MAG TPA: hypothetical protein PLJ37_05620 [Chitinophagales bacterium]|nr:hypothetical protein [Chitinophagales bacterium]HMU98544.1 hypothetical protein [Chitinophagales bacterium]HMV02798.1 hypothetical protein [Chitinophagales bacterium]HMW94856.1 hypothetical protein [Chitinophagales bacterium]HMY41737.1 hypothetical protein [Chitinophagales bacterium]